ncbi:MAG: DUF4936 family protein [Caldimonas sp.]
MRELFVYYRIDPAAAVAARDAVEAMHERLRRAHPGLVARLLIRASDGSAPLTWMETYALPRSPDGVGPDIEAGIEAQASQWADLVAGPRHVEAFTAGTD